VRYRHRNTQEHIRAQAALSAVPSRAIRRAVHKRLFHRGSRRATPGQSLAPRWAMPFKTPPARGNASYHRRAARSASALPRPTHPREQSHRPNPPSSRKDFHLEGGISPRESRTSRARTREIFDIEPHFSRHLSAISFQPRERHWAVWQQAANNS